MTLPCKEQGVSRPGVLYIRGIPFQCPDAKSNRPLAGDDSQSVIPGKPLPGCCPSQWAARNLGGSEGDLRRSREGLRRSRRSVRMFTEQAVPLALLRDLLIRACADLGRATRHVRCVMVEAAPTVKRVREMTAAWLSREGLAPRKNMGSEAEGGDLFGGAPHLVVVHGPRDLPEAVEACALAVARLEWAAAGAGLGVCFAGELVAAASQDRSLAATLTVPEEHAIHGALLLGYSAFTVRDPDSVGRVRIVWL